MVINLLVFVFCFASTCMQLFACNCCMQQLETWITVILKGYQQSLIHVICTLTVLYPSTTQSMIFHSWAYKWYDLIKKINTLNNLNLNKNKNKYLFLKKWFHFSKLRNHRSPRKAITSGDISQTIPRISQLYCYFLQKCNKKTPCHLQPCM